MSMQFALHFAEDWIASWNSHDLDRILAHYAQDFEMSSPLIVQLMDEPSAEVFWFDAESKVYRAAAHYVS